LKRRGERSRKTKKKEKSLRPIIGGSKADLPKGGERARGASWFRGGPHLRQVVLGGKCLKQFRPLIAGLEREWCKRLLRTQKAGSCTCFIGLFVSGRGKKKSYRKNTK